METNWYKRTEKVLYLYKNFTCKIQALESQLEELLEGLEPSIIGRYELVEGKSYTTSNKVEKAAIERASNPKIKELQRKVKSLHTLGLVITDCLNNMDEESRNIVNMIYVAGYSWEHVCESLALGKDSYYKKKNKAVREVAWCLGYIDDGETDKNWILRGQKKSRKNQEK